MAEKIEIVDSVKALADLEKISKKLGELEQQILDFSTASKEAGVNLTKIKVPKDLESSISNLEKEQKKAVATTEKARKARLREADAIDRNKKSLDRQRKSSIKATEATKNQSKANKTLTNTFKNLLTSITAFIGVRMLIQFAKDTFELVKSLNSMAFAMKAVIKDTYELAQSQIWLREITNKFGAELVTTTSRYIKFRAAAIQAGLTAKETQKIFGTMTKAAGVLGLKTDELRGIYLALEQMISKGKITTEELRRQLGERLPGAMDIMAKSMGVTTSELDKMMKKGLVISKDVLPKFAEQIEKSFGIQNVEKVDTLTASTIRLGNSWTELLIDLEGSKGGVSGFFKFFIETADEVIKRWGSLNTIMNSNIDMWIAFKAIAKTPFSADDLHALAKKIRYDKEHNILLKEANRLFEERSNKLAPILDLTGSEIDLNKLNNEQLTIWIASMKAKAKVDKKEIEDGNNKIVYLEGTVGWYEQLISKTKELIKMSDDPNVIQKLQEDIKGFNDEIKRLTTGDKYWLDQIVEIDTETFEDDIDILKQGVKSYAESLGLDGDLALEQYLAKHGETFDKIREGYKKLEEQAKEYNSIEKQLLNELADLKKDIYQGVFDFASELSNSLFEVRIQNIDKDIERNNDYYDNQIALAEGNKDEQDRLDNERKIKDDKLQNDKEKAEKKQFLASQAFKLAEIYMNTAQSVAAVKANIAILTSMATFNPFLATLIPLAAAQIPFVIASGALAAGTVLAQSIPAFKDGTNNAPSGFAIVGDGGKHEYIEDRFGNIIQTPNTDTLINLGSGGQKIHKDIDSLASSKGYNSDDIYKATVMASLASERQMSTLKLEKIFNDNLKDLDKKMTKGIQDGFRNVQFHSHNNVDINHALWAKSQEL